MGKTAIILGASGLTGSLLLDKLLADDRYDTIKLFSRTKIQIVNSKIVEKVGNIIELESFKNDFTADELYCCIGTTKSKTPDKAIYKSIDFGIPLTAAKLAKDNNINTFIVISALGANSKSSVFYTRTKGEMELAVLNEKILNTYILQPSIIGGNRKEKRTLEKIGLMFMRLLQPLFIGSFKKYKIVEAKYIAQAMINLANSKSKTIKIITSDKIQAIANY